MHRKQGSPARNRAAADHHHADDQQHSHRAPAGQLTCAGCGVKGEQPRIIWQESDRPDVVIRPVFGWWPDDPGKPALLCDECAAALVRRKRKRRRL